jgi:hypothetical protein
MGGVGRDGAGMRDGVVACGAGVLAVSYRHSGKRLRLQLSRVIVATAGLPLHVYRPRKSLPAMPSVALAV